MQPGFHNHQDLRQQLPPVAARLPHQRSEHFPMVVLSAALPRSCDKAVAAVAHVSTLPFSAYKPVKFGTVVTGPSCRYARDGPLHASSLTTSLMPSSCAVLASQVQAHSHSTALRHCAVRKRCLSTALQNTTGIDKRFWGPSCAQALARSRGGTSSTPSTRCPTTS